MGGGRDFVARHSRLEYVLCIIVSLNIFGQYSKNNFHFRCGSTLFCQMFDKIPETRSMSEPWATVVAHVNYNGGLISHQGTDYEEIIKACIRIQCKPEKKSYIKRIFYKQATWASAQVIFKFKYFW